MKAISKTAPQIDLVAMAGHLARQPDVVAFYLFGSAARGRTHKLSDVDVAVLFDERVKGEEGVVPADLFPRLIDVARFRDLLVHEYAKIDDAIVYGIPKKRLGDFDRFAKAIVTYLERPTP